MARALFVMFMSCFAIHRAHGLTGELLEVKDLIPQICRVKFNSGEICSGAIAGRKMVVLADHCGLMVKKHGSDHPIGKIRCLGEIAEHDFNEMHQINAEDVTRVTGEKFKDSALPRASDTSPIESSRFDVSVAIINDEFRSKPLPIARESQADTIQYALSTGNCAIFGVGLNPFGTFGLAHGVHAPIHKALGGPSNPLELKGNTGVSPMDSGGPLTCEIDGENVLVGVTSRGNGEVASPASEVTSTNVATSVFAYVADPALHAWLSAFLALESKQVSAIGRKAETE